MKRIISTWIISMLLGLLSAMAQTQNSEHLVFVKAWTDGDTYAGVQQQVHIEVTNTGTEDYFNWWCVGREIDWYNFHQVEIRAGETKEIIFTILMKDPGGFQLYVFDLTTESSLYNFVVQVKPAAETKLKGSIELKTQVDDSGNRFLYSDFKEINIQGTVTVTNEGKTTLNNESLFLQVLIDGNNLDMRFNLPEGIKSGESICRIFTFRIGEMPEENKEYTIQLMYLDNVLATSVPFTFRRSTNTYWSADGNQKPLPVNDGHILKVPNDALAVDMRGLYEMDEVFSIDVSEANPNCLYYLNYLDNVPKGFPSETNVIRDQQASSLVIDSNYDYYCPIIFQAKSALFIYTPISESMGPASPVMSQKLSGTVKPPFQVRQAWLVGTNDSHPENPFYNDDFKIARVGTYSNGLLSFDPVVSMDKLYPCDYYLIYDMKPSSLAFYSENMTIFSRLYSQNIPDGFFYDGFGIIEPENGEVVCEESWQPWPAKKNTYSWNCDRNCFVQNEERALIRPFTFTVGIWDETNKDFADLGLDVLPFRIEESTHTAIKDVNKNEDTPQQVAVYSLSGQQVGTATSVNGQIKAEGLKPGMYVAGGRKIFIK